MDCEQVWTFFLATGLPEAYTFYCQVRDEARDVPKTA